MLLCACKAPQPPHVAPAAAVTIDLTRPGMALRGVAAGPHLSYAALAGGGKTIVEAFSGPSHGWEIELAGDGGPITAVGGFVYAVSAARGPRCGGSRSNRRAGSRSPRSPPTAMA